MGASGPSRSVRRGRGPRFRRRSEATASDQSSIVAASVSDSRHREESISIIDLDTSLAVLTSVPASRRASVRRQNLRPRPARADLVTATERRIDSTAQSAARLGENACVEVNRVYGSSSEKT